MRQSNDREQWLDIQRRLDIELSEIQQSLDSLLKSIESMRTTQSQGNGNGHLLRSNTRKDNTSSSNDMLVTNIGRRVVARAHRHNTSDKENNKEISASSRRNRCIPTLQIQESSFKSTSTRYELKPMSQVNKEHEDGAKQQVVTAAMRLNHLRRNRTKENTTNASNQRAPDLQRKPVLESQSHHSKTNNNEAEETARKSGTTKWMCNHCPASFYSYNVAKIHQRTCMAALLTRSTPKSSQPSEKDNSKSTSDKIPKPKTKTASTNLKSTNDNLKTEAVVMCSHCDKIITGSIRTKSTSVDDAGFQCSECGDPSLISCYECTLDWGSFCDGVRCKRYYCDSCRPEYFGAEGDGEQYCGRTCMEPWHPDFKKYARYRLRYSEEEMEEDKIARMCGYRQCKGVTQKGFRCKVKSTHDLWSASSLQRGDDFCLHHGGRDSGYDNYDY